MCVYESEGEKHFRRSDCPWYCDAGLSVVHLLGFGRSQTLAQSTWFCSKVWGQLAGSASWWRARVGWAARYGRAGNEGKRKERSLKCGQIPTATFLIHRTRGPGNGGISNVKPQEHRRLLNKHLVANRWRATAIEVQFQEHQQLSHLAAQITYTRPYIEDSWHPEAAGLGLTWSCHHPEHQTAAKEPGQIPTGSPPGLLFTVFFLYPRAANY